MNPLRCHDFPWCLRAVFKEYSLSNPSFAYNIYRFLIIYEDFDDYQRAYRHFDDYEASRKQDPAEWYKF